MFPRRALFVPAIAGSVLLGTTAAHAQDLRGVEWVFGVNHGIELGRNIGLDTPEGGARATLSSRLNFGLRAESDIERFALDARSVLRFVREEYEDPISELTSPNITLSYERDGARASFRSSARFRVEDIETLRSLSSFINDDGVLELPEDYDSLSGTGQRTTYGIDATLTLGIDEPLGFVLDVGASGTLYNDTTDPGLFDTRRYQVSGTTRLDISPVLTGTLRLGYEVRDEDNTAQTRRETTSARVGLNYAASERATIDGHIEGRWIETEETDSFREIRTTSGRVALSYDMPNGEAGLVLSSTADTDGDQTWTLSASRSMEFQTDAFAATLGVTRPDNGDVALIGSLAWQRIFPTGSLTTRFRRSVTVDADDNTRLATSASSRFTYDINDVSSFALDASYTLAEGTSASNEVSEAEINATYSHALTEDWNFNAAVGYRVRDEDTIGQSESPLVSLSISRDFLGRF